MTVTLLIFAYRKPGVSPEDFRTHCENSHVPLLKSLMGPLFPLSHTRRYIHRTEQPSGAANVPSDGGLVNGNRPATLIFGTQEAVDYDAVIDMVFESKEALQAFQGKMSEEEVTKKIGEDEAKFSDRSRMVMVLVDDTLVTKRGD